MWKARRLALGGVWPVWGGMGGGIRVVKVSLNFKCAGCRAESDRPDRYRRSLCAMLPVKEDRP